MHSTMRAVALGLLVLSSTGAWAAPGTVLFSGVVTSKDSTTSGRLNDIKVGDRIEGSFSYDASAAVDSNSWDVVGQYAFTAANSAFSISAYDSSAGHTVHYAAIGFLESVVTENNWTAPGYPTIDALTPTGSLLDGFHAVLYLQNRDSNLGLITSDALPQASTIRRSNYNYTKGTLFSDSSIGQVYFDLTSVSAVPEPAAYVQLLAGGLLLFTLILSRRRGGQQDTVAR
jgi:hypothetical protein